MLRFLACLTSVQFPEGQEEKERLEPGHTLPPLPYELGTRPALPPPAGTVLPRPGLRAPAVPSLPASAEPAAMTSFLPDSRGAHRRPDRRPAGTRST